MKSLINIIFLIGISFTLIKANDIQNLNLYKSFQTDKSWGKHYNMPALLSISTLTTALVTGNDTRFGATTWKSLDALWTSTLVTTAIKTTFGRVRPRDAHLYPEDKQWFQKGNASFVSGHTSAVTAIVTPYILEYQKEYPWVNALWLLPVQQMIGRYKDKAHYKSDVIGGFIVGFLSGYMVSKLDTPILLQWKKDGVYAGLSWDF